jgi:hypothetical protein
VGDPCPRPLHRLFGVLLIAVSLAIAAPPVHAAKSGSRAHSSSHHAGKAKASHSAPSRSSSRKATNVARDSNGRIKRDPAARGAFQRSNPCPSTGKKSGACPGYVIDHVRPLKRGGADSPSNMQWQTTAEARRKDRTE